MEAGLLLSKRDFAAFSKKLRPAVSHPLCACGGQRVRFLGRNVFFCVHAAEKMIVLYSRLRARTPAESFFFFWGCAVQMFSRRRSSFTRSRPMGRGLDAPRTRSAKLLLFQGKMS